MRGFVPPDPEGGISKIHYAVVYVPGRNRNRFAASCVEIKDTAATAIATADANGKKYAARVVGPSKSSEGQTIYYLLEWLNEKA